MRKVKPLSSILPEELPFTKKTIYKYHSQGVHPQLIYKVGGKLCFDFDEWERMCEQAKTANVRTAKNIKAPIK